MASEIVPVTKLQRGDLIDMRPYSDHVVKILRGPLPTKDRFGMDRVKFEAEIVSGPDRVGAKGPMTFGHEGVARRII